MLELDDIQHILMTRTPAITGRYEFLTFDTPAGGRAWLSELLPVVQSAADGARHDGRLRAVGHTGVHLERPARARGTRGIAGNLPRRVSRGHGGPRRHPRGHRGSHPTTGSAGWRATTCTRSRSCSPATTTNTPGPSRSTTSCWPGATACAACRTSTSTRRRRSTTPMTTSGSGTGCRSR